MATSAASADQDFALPGLTLYEGLLTRLQASGLLDPDHSELVDQAAEIWSRPGFDVFVSLEQLRFEPFDYQIQTAQTVLRKMRGRAILADEVGLGKTIEAGIILAELRMRGLADRALVLTPAGLVEQWREELERKFGLPTTIVSGKSVDTTGVALASLAAARRDPLKSQLTSDTWDVVIVDEAHRLRNPRTASGKLARALSARHLLLLTATPVENKLIDLYELISLVSPGLLGTAGEFRRKHAGSGDIDSRTPRNVEELRNRTREVMVRHRRSEVALRLPHRLAETRIVTPTSYEADLYATIAARIRDEARSAAPTSRLALRTLARLAGSSPAAAAPTLAKLGWDGLSQQALRVGRHSKADELVERLGRSIDAGEKVLVFTAFKQTLSSLAKVLDDKGIPAAVYHGSLSRQEKEQAISSFREDVPVLLTTESAGEGRNLQFCHVMINIDLPWNPMQIEQRLGRLHRVGQQHDVHLTNLVARGTIEEQILHVLEAKINLFELVVGELDMILGHIDDDLDFESLVFDAYVQAEDDAEFATRMESIGDSMAQARVDYLQSRDAIDSLAGDAHE